MELKREQQIARRIKIQHVNFIVLVASLFLILPISLTIALKTQDTDLNILCFKISAFSFICVPIVSMILSKINMHGISEEEKEYVSKKHFPKFSYIAGKSVVGFAGLFLDGVGLMCIFGSISWLVSEQTKDSVLYVMTGFGFLFGLFCLYFGVIITKSLFTAFKDSETYQNFDFSNPINVEQVIDANSAMQYFSTTLATNFKEEDMRSWKVRLMYILLFFIPKANPDNEPLYPKVKRWLIEVDENNLPIREVGLDKEDNYLFRAPEGRNYGFWTDSSEPISMDELEQIEKTDFESQWEKGEPKQ